MKEKIPDHIEEYFTKIEGTKEAFHSRELFRGEEEGIDLKTHLTDEEIALINTLIYNDELLKKRKLKPIFKNFLYRFMRLKVSKDRLSRQEFVNINKTGDSTEDKLNMASNLANITKPRT
jgi:hypothetical protein